MSENSESDQSNTERIAELEKQIQIQNQQLQALNRWVGELESALLGSYETDDIDVESANIQGRVDDMGTAMQVVASRLEGIEQAPGDNAKSTRIAKIRRSLVRRAKRSGTATVGQAAQERPTKMDAGEIQTLFENDISRSYASELVGDAADGEAFWVDRQEVKGNPNDKKVLRVDITALDADSPYLAASEADVGLGQIGELLGVGDKLHAEGAEE